MDKTTTRETLVRTVRFSLRVLAYRAPAMNVEVTCEVAVKEIERASERLQRSAQALLN